MKANQPDSEMNHPSFLALDRAHLGLNESAVTVHLDRCEACRQYLEALRTPPLLPSFLSQPEFERRRFRGRQLLGAASLVAAACGVFLFVQHGKDAATRADEAYVGEKGFRSVWIYVRRGAETQLWDGKQPVVAGDRIRLKVDAGSFHRVEVYSANDPHDPTRLYEGTLSPGQTVTLPEAWEIDDSPAPEQLFVVFSDATIAPSWEHWRHGKVQPGVAVLPFILPKKLPLAPDAGPQSP